uniref:Disease resistance protein n=1 Tax=Kalanchoe fedtschenkoi TaxID=63787 RepID=A0A7N0TXA2_KALFE
MIPSDDYERMGWENDNQVSKRPPPNLSHLQISSCYFQTSAKVLTYFFNLNAPITSLEFSVCYVVESFPPDVELPSTLQSLKITSCHALTTISGEFLSSCSNSLRELTIENCDNLVCLPRSLSTLQSLRILSLLECPKLVILKDCGLPTALTHLTIKNCDEMKAVSNLRLTKLTSLTHLELEEFQETSRHEAGCLPESIEELIIWDLPRLESLSGVLPTLKNLR